MAFSSSPKLVLLATVCFLALAVACDEKCLNQEALDLVNDFRRSQGKAPLMSGTNAMLHNAVSYSQEMYNKGRLEHQDLRAVDLGCGIFFNAENIAMFSGGSSSNAPKRCIDMWIGSPGHRANLLRDTDMTVVGIRKNGGTVYCTQTFGKILHGTVFNAGNGNCDLASQGSANTNAPSTTKTIKSATTMPPTTTTASTTTMGPSTNGMVVNSQPPTPMAPGTNSYETTRKTCTQNFERCAGAEYKPFHQYYPCCTASFECVENPEIGWGKFCMPKDPNNISTEDTEGSRERPPTTIEGTSNSGFRDRLNRKFILTGREFEEECTTAGSMGHRQCLLCLKGAHPPRCYLAKL